LFFFFFFFPLSTFVPTITGGSVLDFTITGDFKPVLEDEEACKGFGVLTRKGSSP
jgi:hypothetical protein